MDIEKKLVNKKIKDLKVLSLFSGCGGLDLGLEGDFEVIEEAINRKTFKGKFISSKKSGWLKLRATRFKTVFANDIRPSAKALWNLNFSRKFQTPKDIYNLESIVDLVKRYWDGERSVFPKDVDLVTGGFPCQDFSIAGKRKGFESHKNHFGEKIKLDEASEESRGKLYMWMREVIDITRPKMFIAENVKGMSTLENVVEIIRKDFEKIGDSGYLVINPQILHAANFGIPQSRERIFFMGFRKDLLSKEALNALSSNQIPQEFNPYPGPTHFLDNDLVKLKSQIKYSTTLNAFKDLLEPKESKDLSQKSFSRAKWYGKHCQGNIEVKLDNIAPTIRSEHHGNIEFRRLSPKNGGKHLLEFKKGQKERRLSVRECARIQTFPDDFDFVIKSKQVNISTSEAYKLIGNAVPPLLGYHLATRIEELWPKFFKKD